MSESVYNTGDIHKNIVLRNYTKFIWKLKWEYRFRFVFSVSSWVFLTAFTEDCQVPHILRILRSCSVWQVIHHDASLWHSTEIQMKKMLSSIWNLNPPSNKSVGGIVSELNYSMTEESHQETGLQTIILLCIHMGVSFLGIILFKYKLQSLFMFVFFESMVPKTISDRGTLKHKFV